MTNRILVTGGTGNIGRELVKQLQARGADFAIMSSKPGKAASSAREVYGDFTQPASLAGAFTGIDTLFLLFPPVPGMPDMARNAVAAAPPASSMSGISLKRRRSSLPRRERMRARSTRSPGPNP